MLKLCSKEGGQKHMNKILKMTLKLKLLEIAVSLSISISSFIYLINIYYVTYGLGIEITAQSIMNMLTVYVSILLFKHFYPIHNKLSSFKIQHKYVVDAFIFSGYFTFLIQSNLYIYMEDIYPLLIYSGSLIIKKIFINLRNKKNNDLEIVKTAIHEAGHIIYLKNSLIEGEIEKASIIPEGNVKGYVRLTPPIKMSVSDDIELALAGDIATWLFVENYKITDIQQYVNSIIKRELNGDDMLETAIQVCIFNSACITYFLSVKKCIKKNRKAVIEVATALYDSKELSGNEIENILKRKKL